MSLPAWTVIPIFIGFFTMLIKNSEFYNYIIGFQGTTEIDVVRLIINSFIVGVPPTVSGVALFISLRNIRALNTWYSTLSGEFKQLAFIVSTLVWTLSFNAAMDRLVGKEFAKELANKVVQSGKESESSVKERMYAIESKALNTALASASLARTSPHVKARAEELEKAANEMGALARQVQKAIPNTSKAGIEKTTKLLRAMEAKTDEMETINSKLKQESLAPYEKSVPAIQEQ